MNKQIGLAIFFASWSVCEASAEVCDKFGGVGLHPAPQNFPGSLAHLASSPWTYLLLAVLVLAWKASGRWRGFILSLAALSVVLNGFFTWALIDEYRAQNLVLQSALREGCRSLVGDIADQLRFWLFTALLGWAGFKPWREGSKSHGASQP